MQVDSRFAYAYTLLGHEYVLVEELEKALSCFRTAVRHAGDNKSNRCRSPKVFIDEMWPTGRNVKLVYSFKVWETNQINWYLFSLQQNEMYGSFVADIQYTVP